MDNYFQGHEAPQQLRSTLGSGPNNVDSPDEEESSAPYLQQLANINFGTWNPSLNHDSRDFQRLQCSNGASDVSQGMNMDHADIICGIQPQCQAHDERATSLDWQKVADILTDESQSRSSIPLEQWIEIERGRSSNLDRKESVFRKLSVAYGICKLLESSGVSKDRCTISNFSVREHDEESNTTQFASRPDLVAEVVMDHPSSSVQLVAATQQYPNGSQQNDSTEEEDPKGIDIQAIIQGDESDSTCVQGKDPARDERGLCYALGELVYLLFSKQSNVENGKTGIRNTIKAVQVDTNEATLTQPRKKQSSFEQASISAPKLNGDIQYGNISFKPSSHIQLEYDCLPAISQLIGDLLSCDDELFCSDSAFKYLKDVAGELHLLLKEPTSFLFERVFPTHLSKHFLTFSHEKLFGRSVEISDISDAFHRVASTGRSECIIVVGESG